MGHAEDIVARVKISALAWLARHHDVTLGQAITYLMLTHQKHWPVVVDAWRSHGASPELVEKLVRMFVPQPQQPPSEAS